MFIELCYASTAEKRVQIRNTVYEAQFDFNSAMSIYQPVKDTEVLVKWCKTKNKAKKLPFYPFFPSEKNRASV